MAQTTLVHQEHRATGRDDVQFRARAVGPLMQPLSLLIVNLSAQGLMARCDAALSEGDRLRVTLPVVGLIGAEVRWALGGRIGLQLDRAIDLSDYYGLLARVVQGR